jgi:hypothetical protein
VTGLAAQAGLTEQRGLEASIAVGLKRDALRDPGRASRSGSSRDARPGTETRHVLVRYAQEELVLESIAWSCCQTVGLDATANSIPYLTSWAQSASLDLLEQTAALTGRLSDRIEAALSERPTDAILEPATAATAA